MPLDELVGHILDGRYKVLEPISEGAMGVVYRGERLKLGRPVAIKVMRDQLPNELSSRKRFEVEAKAMARLEHPHCVSVLDVGLHEDKPYVVMDFISGTNLREMLDTARLEIPRAVEMMRQILSGLGHAHELGIMHRDIKPANIMVSKKTGIGDQVKILDFGLARLDQDSQLTGTMVLGTPAYMAPEQCTGGAIDFRTDLYACGVLMFEMLTGHKPFHSEKDDPIEVVRMHIDNPPPRLDDKAPGMDFGELEAVVAHALAKSPAARFQSAAEFVAALDAAAAPFRTSGPISVPQSGPIAVPKSGPTRPATSPTVASPARTGSTQVGAAAPPRNDAPQVDAKFSAQAQSPPAWASSPPKGLDAKFGASKDKTKEPSFDPSWSWPSSEESDVPSESKSKSSKSESKASGSKRAKSDSKAPDSKSDKRGSKSDPAESAAQNASESKSSDASLVDARATADAADAKASGVTSSDARAADAKPGTKSADAKSADAKSADAKSAGAQSADAKSTDAKSTDAKSAEAKSADAKSADAKSTDAKASGPKSADAKSADAKSADAKSADAKSADAKSADAKSADAKSADAKSADAKSADAKSADAKSADAKSTDAKSADAKSAGPKSADAKSADARSSAKTSSDVEPPDTARHSMSPVPSEVLSLESRLSESKRAAAKPGAPVKADVPAARAVVARDPAASDPMAAFQEPPAQAEDEAGLAMTPDSGPRLRRRKLMMIGGGALGGIVLIAIIASRGGSSTPSDRHDKPAATDKLATKPTDRATDRPTDKPADPSVKPAGTPTDTTAKPAGSDAPGDDGPPKVISDATALIGEGKPDAALARIAKGRKQYFANPDLPYFAGRIQFSRQHYSDGLAAFRDAIKLDESFRSNRELIQMLVDGFTTTKERNAQIASFLHDVIGDAAVPILERATREHPDPAMRERVTKELARFKK